MRKRRIGVSGRMFNGVIIEIKNIGYYIIIKLICTDSHVNTQYINGEFVEVRSLAGLICEAIKITH